MQHDHAADRVLKALSDITHQTARWSLAVFDNGSAKYFADHQYSAEDLAQLLRLNADQLHPETCQHTEAIALYLPRCTVCGAVRRGKHRWNQPVEGN